MRPYTAVSLVFVAGVATALWAIYPAVGMAVAALALALACFCLLFLLGTLELSPFSNEVVPLFEGAGSDGPPPRDAERLLDAADAFDEESDGDILAPAFESDWRSRMVRMERAADAENLAALYALDPDLLELDWYPDGLVALYDGRYVGRWLSRAAFVADVSATRELRGRISGWREVPADERDRALSALRLCLDRCPVCDADVVLRTETVESDPDRGEVLTSTCRGCNARLFETECDPATFDPIDA